MIYIIEHFTQHILNQDTITNYEKIYNDINKNFNTNDQANIRTEIDKLLKEMQKTIVTVKNMNKDL